MMAVRRSSAAPTAARTLNLPDLAGASGCLALALLVHVSRLPPWVTLTIGVAAGIRLSLAWRGLPPPPQWARLLVAALAVGVLFAQFHTFNGINAGTALLALMAGFKLLEAKGPRDIGIIILIVYFLCLAALLTGTSLLLLSYLLTICWLTTAALLRASVSIAQPDWPASLRHAARMILLAIPLAGVLWLFFPRFAGPLWHLPQDSATAESGLSDHMSPGDLSQLSMSDDIAFRVRFATDVPPPQNRYWRGPVLSEFDGRNWSREPGGMTPAPQLKAIGRVYRYTLSLEPQPHNWLFALDWPQTWDIERAFLNRDDMLVQTERVSRQTDVTVESYLEVQAMGPLSTGTRRRNTFLPPSGNARTREFAGRLRAQHADDIGYANAILDLFRRQAFYYTLTPPRLGRDSIDEFLFDVKRGFCEHYASAFAVLMRAAGIPTRVVTGYQGGTFNRFAGHWVIRQSDAHAWDEAWIEGRGWVRFDPTAAVAPERTERGAEAILDESPDEWRWYNLTPWLADLRLRMDALRDRWRRSVLNYNSDAQMSLLEQLGVPQPDPQKLILTMAAALSLALVWLAWQVHKTLLPQRDDPLLRGLARIEKKLAAVGLPRAPTEGASTYARRVAAARPDIAATTTALLQRYVRLRYELTADADAARGFERAARRLRVSKAPRRQAYSRV
jgi:protein-glutamine gamma-glutamyltransferase